MKPSSTNRLLDFNWCKMSMATDLLAKYIKLKPYLATNSFTIEKKETRKKNCVNWKWPHRVNERKLCHYVDKLWNVFNVDYTAHWKRWKFNCAYLYRKKHFKCCIEMRTHKMRSIRCGGHLAIKQKKRKTLKFIFFFYLAPCSMPMYMSQLFYRSTRLNSISVDTKMHDQYNSLWALEFCACMIKWQFCIFTQNLNYIFVCVTHSPRLCLCVCVSLQNKQRKTKSYLCHSYTTKLGS